MIWVGTLWFRDFERQKRLLCEHELRRAEPGVDDGRCSNGGGEQRGWHHGRQKEVHTGCQLHREFKRGYDEKKGLRQDQKSWEVSNSSIKVSRKF